MRHLPFFFLEALIGMKRSGVMMFIAIVTISVSLIVFGFFLLLSSNMSKLADFISSKLEIRIFLEEQLTFQEVEKFTTIVNAYEDIKSVSFVDKDDAWKEFKSNYSNLNLSDLVSENPLPNMLKVMLVKNDKIYEIANNIKSHKEFVSDVSYGGIIAERMNSFSKWVKWSGIVLVSFLTVATLFIIVNTIRLTIISRKDEVEIMSLVGATPAFISGPFLIEGLLMGSIGSGIAVCFLTFSYQFFAFRLQEALPYFPLVFKSVILTKIYLAVFVLGAVLGIFGAYISVSRILKKVI